MVVISERSAYLLTVVFVAFYIIFVTKILTDRRKTKEENFEVQGWEKGVSRDVRDYVDMDSGWRRLRMTPFPEDSSSLVRLLVSVHSAPNDEDKREFIRWNFGKGCRNKESFCRLIFVLGSQYVDEESGDLSDTFELVKQEYFNYGDILFGDFVDSYNNLTLKSLHAQKYFVKSDMGFTHMFKVDDNCYFNPEKAKIVIADHSIMEDQNYIMGSEWKGVNVVRNSLNENKDKLRFITPRYIYEPDVFPNYMGTSYIMTREASQSILQAAASTPIFFLEDIYITGILVDACLNSEDIGDVRRIDLESSLFWLWPPIKHNFEVKPDNDDENTSEEDKALVDLDELIMAHLEDGPNWHETASKMWKETNRPKQRLLT